MNYLIRSQKKQKRIFLLGDFNINLLKYNEDQSTNKYLDSLALNSLIPNTLQPTSLTSHSNTFIGNIFSNVLSSEAVFGNITATISDHLPQFLFTPNVLSNPLCNKSNTWKEIGQNLTKKILFLNRIGVKFSN